MGIIRLTLFTGLGLVAAMAWFGRDEGLPEHVIGRLPEPEPEASAPPEAVEAVVPVVAQTPAPPAPPDPEPEPAPEPPPEPEPEPAPEPVPEAPTMLTVTGRFVNVRAGPGTGYAALTSLAQGAQVEDMGEAGDGWRMIRLESGETGYMSGDFLSPLP